MKSTNASREYPCRHGKGICFTRGLCSASCFLVDKRIAMNKLNRLAALVAAAARAAGAAQAQAVDNGRAADGTGWKNGTNELCWRDAFWTPATGVQGCDGVPVPAAPEAAPAPVAPAPAPVPAPVVAPQAEKVSFAADAFFDFD